MFKPHWIFIPFMMTTGAGFAQSLLEQAAAQGTVVSSTDPAVVAEVERKAAEIVAAREREGQQSSGSGADATTGATSEAMPSNSKSKSNKQNKQNKQRMHKHRGHGDDGKYSIKS